MSAAWWCGPGMRKCLLIWDDLACLGQDRPVTEGTFEMHRSGGRARVVVSADGRGVVSHAGTRLLTDIAEVTGLTGGFSDALAVAGRRAGGHDRGRVAVDLATMLADG